MKKEDLQGFVNEIGYVAKWTNSEKKHLLTYWKFLSHIIANILSKMKGGFDKLRTDWVRVMAFLTNIIQCIPE